MSRPQKKQKKLNTHSEETELRVSTLELFFDLVFVFTITQLTALVEHNTSFVGVIKAIAIFAVMYWMYSGYAWLTNQVPPITTSRRLLLVSGMAAFLVCALAIPEAFEHTALPFSIGYALVVLVHSGLYAQVHRSTVWRFVPLNLIGAACLVGAAFAEGWVRYALWAVTIALHFVTSALASQVRERESSGYQVHAGHFVERHGLLLIVAFGESIVAIGIGLAEVELTLTVYAAAVLGLILVGGLWWTFFISDQERSEEILLAAPLTTRVRLALNGYFFSFMPILFGIVTLSAGLGHALSHIMEPLPIKESILLGVGTALYLLGTASFRQGFGIRPIAPRLIAAVASIVTYLAGVAVSAFAQVGLLIVIVIAFILFESSANAKSGKHLEQKRAGGK